MICCSNTFSAQKLPCHHPETQKSPVAIWLNEQIGSPTSRSGGRGGSVETEASWMVNVVVDVVVGGGSSGVVAVVVTVICFSFS